MKYHAGPTLWNEAVSVGGADDDFSTIQAAIDWFKRFRITGSCTISLDAGTYDEAVVVEDLLIAAGSGLTLAGDTRELAGLSYVDGAVCNQSSLANGGSGACGLASAGTDITVTGGGGNPDFDADGWDSGDTILVYDNAGATTEETISSVANNVITLTGAAPVVGNDGTAICLLPNRRIERSSAGQCILVSDVKRFIVDGLYLVPSTGASCHGIELVYGSMCVVRNTAVRPEDRGFTAGTGHNLLDANEGAISVWGASLGYTADLESTARVQYAISVDCSTAGFYATRGGVLLGDDTVSVNCGNGYDARNRGLLESDNGTARQCTTGYDAQFGAYIYAPSSNANNNGNGADYDPLPGGFPGSNQGNHYAVVYAS